MGTRKKDHKMKNNILRKKNKAMEPELDRILRGGNEPEPKAEPSQENFSFPLTAEKLFRMALNVPDPAHGTLGYYYEAELRRECRILVPHPLYRQDRAGIMAAYQLWENNRRCFLKAIDEILSGYARKAGRNG